MKKSKLLLIAAFALTLASCAGDNGTKSAASGDSTKVENEPFETELNIRYVSMDSISKNYILAQNVALRAQGLASDLQAYQAKLQNSLQSKANQIQQKAQSNGYLSQASYEADLKELDTENTRAQNQYAKKEQEAASTMEVLQKELRDSIENFINSYNKVKKYDAILYKDAGLYFNPALDITDEVVQGLNDRYTGKAAPGAAAAAATNPGGELNAPTTLDGTSK